MGFSVLDVAVSEPWRGKAGAIGSLGLAAVLRRTLAGPDDAAGDVVEGLELVAGLREAVVEAENRCRRRASCGWRCRGSHGSSSPLGSRCSRDAPVPARCLRRGVWGVWGRCGNLQFVDKLAVSRWDGSELLHADLRHHLGSARVSERDEKEETTDVVYWISAS